MNILEVQLQTNQLAAQKDFYTARLGLPLLAESADSFTIRAGRSRLTFSKAQDTALPFYHFAFNIPENLFAEAKTWLSSRLDTLSVNGKDEQFFEDWNAHAVYFYDPAHNIVEFIARHNLPYRSQEKFDSRSILSLSEIGLPLKRVRPALDQLWQTLSLERWRGNDSDFAAVGDEEGLFILVSLNRGWLPTGTPAQIYPARLLIKGDREQVVRIEGTPYEIVVSGELAD